MITFPRRTTSLLVTLVTATMASTAAFSGNVIHIADRCAVYGPSFVDLGNGTCGHVASGRIGDASRTWSGSGASNAGLRSDGLGMLPGADNARHLRIQADPDFR